MGHLASISVTDVSQDLSFNNTQCSEMRFQHNINNTNQKYEQSEHTIKGQSHKKRLIYLKSGQESFKMESFFMQILKVNIFPFLAFNINKLEAAATTITTTTSAKPANVTELYAL